MEIKTITLRFTEKIFNRLKREKEKLSKDLEQDLNWEGFFMVETGISN